MMRSRFCLPIVVCLLILSCDRTQQQSQGVGEATRAGPGVTETEIRLGILTDQSSPRDVLALPRLRAARVFFQALNDNGGINGRRVQLVVADHQFNRETALQKYLEMRDSILMVEQVYPVAFLEAELVRDGVLVSPVARYARLAQQPLLVMTGAPYRVEMSNAVDWLAGTLPEPGGTRIAAVTQADEYGADGLAGIEEAANTHRFNLVTRLTYQSTDTDFSAQAAALKDSGAQYVFMTGTSRAAGAIVEGCAEIGYTPSFIGSYFTFRSQMIADNPTRTPLFAKGWKTSGPYAHWGEDVPGMKEMLEAIKRYAPDQTPEHLFLQGWIQARIVTEILKRADDGNDLTRSGIVEALEGMGELELGGLSPGLSFGRASIGQPPTRHTRMFETAVDDPRYPDMLKPITQYYSGETAIKASVAPTMTAPSR
jgi:ABC-type branched-subunit amino acid transport system substrate-binding protein